MSHITYSRCLHHHETDSDGVCHFSNYFRILEEAFDHALASAGMPAHALPHGFAVVNAGCTYLHPLRYGEQFVVDVAFSSVRRSCMVADVVIRKCDLICARLTSRFAAIDRYSNASVPLARGVRAYFDDIRTPREEHTC